MSKYTLSVSTKDKDILARELDCNTFKDTQDALNFHHPITLPVDQGAVYLNNWKVAWIEETIDPDTKETLNAIKIII